MKKFAIILTCALLIGTISGCNTSDTSSTSTETSTTSSEKNYPIHFFPVPDGFEAYYHDKKLDVPLSETESTEKILSIEIERNQDDIKLKAALPLLIIRITFSMKPKMKSRTQLLWLKICII